MSKSILDDLFPFQEKSKNKIYVGSFNSIPEYVDILPIHYHEIDPKDFPNTGFPSIFYTNNPCIVDCFEPDEVHCCYNGIIKKLSEHPECNKWKEEMSAGEMWSLFGVQWVSD